MINWLKEWSFYLLVLGITALGVFLTYQHIPRLEFEFTKAVGHALIIAGILSASVDFYVKKRLVKEAIQSIDKYLIGWQLPRELQDKIRDIIGTSITQKNWHFQYRIMPIKGDSSKVTLEVEISGELENLSSEPKVYQQYLFFEKHNNPCITELRCDSSDGNACYYMDAEVLVNQIQETRQQDRNTILEIYGKEVTLQPIIHNPSLTYHFGAKYSLTVPDRYSDTFIIFGPTINIVITAQYPQEFVFEGPTPTPFVNRWEYRKAFLTGEHITVRWRRKGE